LTSVFNYKYMYTHTCTCTGIVAIFEVNLGQLVPTIEFYKLDALFVTQPTGPKHERKHLKLKAHY